MRAQRDIAIFISLSLLSAAFIISTVALAYRLTPEHRRRQNIGWLLGWCFKGLLLPVLFWTLLNLGVSFQLQPFMPEVQDARNTGGKWLLPFVRVVGYGLFIVSSYWAALTLGWAVIRAAKGPTGEARSDFKGLCVTSGLGMFLPALGLVLLGGLPVAGMAAAAIIAPIAGYAPRILRAKKAPPMYARAIARMKFGKYSEAEWEIIHELEKCEDDFEGWMMLAELYARNFNDLAEAEQTVLEICDQPRTNPSQLSVALHRLSEWHLNLAANPEAARRALQMICDRLPATHLAHMAQLRMNQLPETVAELQEQRRNKPIPLLEPADGEALKLPVTPPVDKERALQMANACVEELTLDPNNIPAREKLAWLLAERLNKVEQGLEQIVLLLNLPEQPDAKHAEWLNLMGLWQINYRQDLESGRKILERVIREFPQSQEAATARRRLQSLDVEYRG